MTSVSHAVVAAVAATIATEHIGLSTVYRNLVNLEGAGLIHRLDAGDHIWRYEPKKDDDRHAHFVCGGCGAVQCLHEGSVSVKGVPGRVGRVASVLSKGSCPDCA